MLRSCYAQREGSDRGEHGTLGQTGLGREYVGHGVHMYKTKKKSGLALKGPGQEDGSEKLKRSRGEKR